MIENVWMSTPDVAVDRIALSGMSARDRLRHAATACDLRR